MKNSLKFLIIFFILFKIILAEELKPAIEIEEIKKENKIINIITNLKVEKFKSFELEQPLRIIIDLYDVAYDYQGIKETKVYKHPIKIIKCAYFQKEPEKITRIVIELEEKVPYSISQINNKIKIDFSSPTKKDSSSNFNNNSKKFTKEEPKISLDFIDADIKSVIKVITYKAKVNIVIAEEVEGKVTICLKDVPWFRALTYVLQMKNFTYKYDEDLGVIQIGSIEYFKKQIEDEKKLKEVTPVETEIFIINYAKAENMKEILPIFLSSEGRIEVVKRTNSLIITDIPTKLKEVKDIIKKLDTTTPQVMIKAKILEISTSNLEVLGIKWDTNLKQKDTTIEGKHRDVVSPGTVSLKIGAILNKSGLEATLNIMQSRGEINVLSSPSVATLDNEKANIMIGQKMPYYTKDEAGNVLTQYVDTGIKLEVTPQVTSDGHIIMEIKPEVSAPGKAQEILTTQAQTKVMVKNEETAVIGGLFKTTDTSFEDKVPFFYNLPLIGWLFKSEEANKDKRELLIFVTPHILSN